MVDHKEVKDREEPDAEDRVKEGEGELVSDAPLWVAVVVVVENVEGGGTKSGDDVGLGAAAGVEVPEAVWEDEVAPVVAVEGGALAVVVVACRLPSLSRPCRYFRATSRLPILTPLFAGLASSSFSSD